MGRKRKLFTTGVVPIGGPSLKSRREARKVTSRFHQLQNEIGEILNTTSDHDDTKAIASKQKQVELLTMSIEEMGGRDRYQQASVVTTAHHSTSKWVVSVLNKLGVYPHGKDMPRLVTLEVGAINTQLQKYPGLAVRAIDINSQHALIEEKNFFDLVPTASHDVVVCSMVVNCVDTGVARGDMLIRLSAQLKPIKGMLFLVLPTKCINNENLSPKQFMQFLKAINLVVPTAQDECYQRLFPNATAESPLDQFCSRVTPKLSFFVLVPTPPSITPLLSACSLVIPVNTSSEAASSSLDEEENWIRTDKKFHHILKSIKMADHAGLLNHFKLSNSKVVKESSKKDKKQDQLSGGGKFNSSEFKIVLPPSLLTAAVSMFHIERKSKKTVKN